MIFFFASVLLCDISSLTKLFYNTKYIKSCFFMHLWHGQTLKVILNSSNHVTIYISFSKISHKNKTLELSFTVNNSVKHVTSDCSYITGGVKQVKAHCYYMTGFLDCGV